MATTLSELKYKHLSYTPPTGVSRESDIIHNRKIALRKEVINRSLFYTRSENILNLLSEVNKYDDLDFILNQLLSLKNPNEEYIVDQVILDIACKWITHFYNEVYSINSDWIEPLMTVSGFGDIVFEWWKGDKKLSIYIASDSIQSIKSWIEDDEIIMEDAEYSVSEMPNQQLWLWLVS